MNSITFMCFRSVLPDFKDAFRLLYESTTFFATPPDVPEEEPEVDPSQVLSPTAVTPRVRAGGEW